MQRFLWSRTWQKLLPLSSPLRPRLVEFNFGFANERNHENRNCTVNIKIFQMIRCGKRKQARPVKDMWVCVPIEICVHFIFVCAHDSVYWDSDQSHGPEKHCTYVLLNECMRSESNMRMCACLRSCFSRTPQVTLRIEISTETLVAIRFIRVLWLYQKLNLMKIYKKNFSIG